MKPKKPKTDPNLDLFRQELKDMLDDAHPLYMIRKLIEWDELHEDLSEYFSEEGAPAKSVQLVAGILYLKAHYNLSDEAVVLQWVENPYWQYFCGEQYFQQTCPLSPSSLVKWRQRLGKKGMKRMHQELYRVALDIGFLKEKDLEEVTADTTVQEKAIAYPVDSKLYFQMCKKLVKLARRLGIELRQSYTRKAKAAYRQACCYGHAKQYKRMHREVRKLRSYLGRLCRDIERKMSPFGRANADAIEMISMGMRLFRQKKTDKKKLYSLHAPEVECIAKGKAHKRYEFGVKVSVMIPAKKVFVLVCNALSGNPFDGHTLPEEIAELKALTGITPKTCLTDAGYKGHAPIEGVNVYRSKQKRGITPAIKNLLKRRSAVEPVIGHMKQSHRMGRNYLKGQAGDAVNAIAGAIGFNFRQLMNHLQLKQFSSA